MQNAYKTISSILSVINVFLQAWQVSVIQVYCESLL